MLIYRVECKVSGTGPYVENNAINDLQRNLVDDLCFKHEGCSDHPAIHSDLFYKVDEMDDYHYGFESLNQLYKWFGEFVFDLIYCGYQVVEYLIVNPDDIILFAKQCVFNKQCAEQERSYELDSTQQVGI